MKPCPGFLNHLAYARGPWTKPRMPSHHHEPVIYANLIISKQARKSDVNASGALSSADTCTCAKKPSANALLSLLRKSPTPYLQDDLPICPTLTPAWIRSGQPASSWFTPSPESAASVAGKGQITLHSMINIFPFDWGNVNDTTIHTDHHITVLNINLELHRATCLVSQCAGVLL